MYAIGIDFGTLTLRGLLVDIHTGQEIAVSEFSYPHSVMERSLPTGECLEHGWALQHPMDYIGHGYCGSIETTIRRRTFRR